MSWASNFIFFISYFVLIMGLLWFAFLQRMKRREGKFPVPDDMRAMRLPGEHLSCELARLGDRFEMNFAILLVLPLLALILPVWMTQWAGATKHVGVLLACGALLLAALIYGIRRMLATTDEIRDKRLALYGERVVGDRLMDLTADGFSVYHDVPCLGGGGAFNLDHVVVGRGGVGIVETKTYRKRAVENGEAHKVKYDGQKLVWPDRTSTEELEQVIAAADWLRKELKKHLNLDVPVRSALTMPGWFVNGGPPQAPVLVENTKRLPHFIRERFQGKLATEQEDLVRRYLRGLCETVSFAEMGV